MSIKFFGLVVLLAATISYDLIADNNHMEEVEPPMSEFRRRGGRLMGWER